MFLTRYPQTALNHISPPAKFSQIILLDNHISDVKRSFILKVYVMILYYNGTLIAELRWKSPTLCMQTGESSCFTEDKKKQETRKNTVVYVLWMGDWITDYVVWNPSKKEEACQEVNLTASPQHELLFPTLTRIYIWFPCQSSPQISRMDLDQLHYKWKPDSLKLTC